MDVNSRLETDTLGDPFPNDKHFGLCTRVRDMREELGRRIQRMSAKSALTIADRLLLAYYQKALKFIEPVPPETLFHTGFAMWKYCSGPDRQKEAREILQILDYLDPEPETKTGLLHALPVSSRPSPKRGAPATRRPAALRALQLRSDTGRTWLSIAQEVCNCEKKEHDKLCRETARQSVSGLEQFLERLGIELPKRPA